jgi:hypothetical protein
VTDPSVRIVHEPIALGEIRAMATERFGDMVKAVVDVRRRMMAVGAELHSDEEDALLETGSAQADVWGINVYPDEFAGEGWIEFDSMINVRPSQHNRSRTVEDRATRDAIREIVGELVVGDD